MIPTTNAKPKIVGNAPPLTYWSGHPNTYGKNPVGKPLYRIVWSDSVYWMIGGLWGDTNTIEYRWCPRYFGMQEWVLEKWMPAKEYCGSREDWDAMPDDHGLHPYGPYPSSGQYEQCYSYKEGEVPNLQEMAQILEHGRNLYSFEQTVVALKLWHENKKKQWGDNVIEEMKEMQPAFGHNPTNLSSTKPTGDTGGLSNPYNLVKEVANHRGIILTDDAPPISLPNPRGTSMGKRRN